MLSKSEEIAIIAPIIYCHHQSKFEVDLNVYYVFFFVEITSLSKLSRDHAGNELYVT